MMVTQRTGTMKLDIIVNVNRVNIPYKDFSLIEYPRGFLCGSPANLFNLGEVHLGSIRVLHIA